MKYKFKIRKTSCPTDQYRDGHHSTEPLLVNHVSWCKKYRENGPSFMSPTEQGFHNTFRRFNNKVEW